MHHKLTTQIGAEGEQVAKEFLESQGFRILEQNVHGLHGEIDLVAEDRDIVVFVEVRSKSHTRYGMPAETVDRKKQEKIRKTAEGFLVSKHWQQRYCRFDVVSIVWEHGVPQIEHIRNAF